MSNKFFAIPETTFDNLVTDVGIILSDFSPQSGSFSVQNIICATTGGVSVSCKPVRTDLADGAENIIPGLLNFMMVESWKGEFSFNSLNTGVEGLALALGVSGLESGGISKVSPKNDFAESYAKDLWWVGLQGESGFAAIRLKNALSDDGFSMKTQKKGKATVSVKLSGHSTIENPKEPPMEFYVGLPELEALTLIDEVTGREYAVTIQNGDMVYSEASGPAKTAYRLIDSETGHIFDVRVAGGNLYYQKEE